MVVHHMLTCYRWFSHPQLIASIIVYAPTRTDWRWNICTCHRLQLLTASGFRFQPPPAWNMKYGLAWSDG